MAVPSVPIALYYLQSLISLKQWYPATVGEVQYSGLASRIRVEVIPLEMEEGYESNVKTSDVELSAATIPLVFARLARFYYGSWTVLRVR
jgi:hypothetical protein